MKLNLESKFLKEMGKVVLMVSKVEPAVDIELSWVADSKYRFKSFPWFEEKKRRKNENIVLILKMERSVEIWVQDYWLPILCQILAVETLDAE